MRALPPLRLTVSRHPAPLPLSSSPRSDGEGKDEGQVAWSCAPYAAAQVAWCRPPSPSAGPWRARSSVLQEPVLQEPHAPTRALDEFARASAPLIGGDALVQEIGVLRTELDVRFEQWAKWDKVPLPGGGVGLSLLDAVIKLLVLASDSKEHCDAFRSRVEELKRAVLR